jgi:hypothetical protein
MTLLSESKIILIILLFADHQLNLHELEQNLWVDRYLGKLTWQFSQGMYDLLIRGASAMRELRQLKD